MCFWSASNFQHLHGNTAVLDGLCDDQTTPNLLLYFKVQEQNILGLRIINACPYELTTTAYGDPDRFSGA